MLFFSFLFVLLLAEFPISLCCVPLENFDSNNTHTHTHTLTYTNAPNTESRSGQHENTNKSLNQATITTNDNKEQRGVLWPWLGRAPAGQLSSRSGRTSTSASNNEDFVKMDKASSCPANINNMMPQMEWQ